MIRGKIYNDLYVLGSLCYCDGVILPTSSIPGGVGHNYIMKNFGKPLVYYDTGIEIFDMLFAAQDINTKEFYTNSENVDLINTLLKHSKNKCSYLLLRRNPTLITKVIDLYDIEEIVNTWSIRDLYDLISNIALPSMVLYGIFNYIHKNNIQRFHGRLYKYTLWHYRLYEQLLQTQTLSLSQERLIVNMIHDKDSLRTLINSDISNRIRVLVFEKCLHYGIAIPDEYLYSNDLEVQYLSISSCTNVQLIKQVAYSTCDGVIHSLAMRRWDTLSKG